jgi:hypothetical protein
MLFQVTQPDPPPEAGPPNIAQRALTKASDTWLKLGDRPKDSWMYWFYARGEKLMDRIEYEEWMLKAIQEDRGVKIAKKEGETQEKIEVSSSTSCYVYAPYESFHSLRQIPLLHPTLKEQPLPPLLPKLHRLLIHRIPHHKKLMYRFLILCVYSELSYVPLLTYCLLSNRPPWVCYTSPRLLRQLPRHLALRHHPRGSQLSALLRPLASVVALQSLARSSLPGKFAQAGHDR